MGFELTGHARQVLAERNIALEWVAITVETPELCEPDPLDPMIERRFRRIPENDNRVLRVAINNSVEPPRVVSVFFDRGMRGRL